MVNGEAANTYFIVPSTFVFGLTWPRLEHTRG